MRSFIALFAAIGAFAMQTPQSGTPVFSTQTRAIQINVVVKDANGHPVRGLTQADFNLADNGKPREIRFFQSFLNRRVEFIPAVFHLAAKAAGDFVIGSARFWRVHSYCGMRNLDEIDSDTL